MENKNFNRLLETLLLEILTIVLFFVVYQLLEGSLDFRVFGSFPIKNLDGSLHIAVYKILNSIWIFFLIVKIIGPRG